jgi:hypothetical protein
VIQYGGPSGAAAAQRCCVVAPVGSTGELPNQRSVIRTMVAFPVMTPARDKKPGERGGVALTVAWMQERPGSAFAVAAADVVSPQPAHCGAQPSRPLQAQVRLSAGSGPSLLGTSSYGAPKFPVSALRPRVLRCWHRVMAPCELWCSIGVCCVRIIWRCV